MEPGHCELGGNERPDSGLPTVKLDPPEPPANVAELRNALRQLNKAYALHKRHRSERRPCQNIDEFVNLARDISRHKTSANRNKYADSAPVRQAQLKFCRQNSTVETTTGSERNEEIMERESSLSVGSPHSRFSSWMSKLRPHRPRSSFTVAPNSQHIHSDSDGNIFRLLPSSHTISDAVLTTKDGKMNFENSDGRKSWGLQSIEPGENENFGISIKGKPKNSGKNKSDNETGSRKSEPPRSDVNKKGKKNKRKCHKKHGNHEAAIPESGDLTSGASRDVRQIPVSELQSFQHKPVNKEAVIQNTQANTVKSAEQPDLKRDGNGSPAESIKHNTKASKHPKAEGIDDEDGQGGEKSSSRKHRNQEFNENPTNSGEMGDKRPDDQKRHNKRMHKHSKRHGENSEEGKTTRDIDDQENIPKDQPKGTRKSKRKSIEDNDLDAGHTDGHRPSKRHHRESCDSGPTANEYRSRHHSRTSHVVYDPEATDEYHSRIIRRDYSGYDDDYQNHDHRRRSRRRSCHHDRYLDDEQYPSRDRSKHCGCSRRDHYDEVVPYVDDYLRDCHSKCRSLPPRICRSVSPNDVENSFCQCSRLQTRKPRSLWNGHCCKCTNVDPIPPPKEREELLDVLNEVCSHLSSRLGNRGRSRDASPVNRLRTPRLNRFLSPETLNLLDVLDPPTHWEEERRLAGYGLPPRAPKRRLSDSDYSHHLHHCCSVARSVASHPQASPPDYQSTYPLSTCPEVHSTYSPTRVLSSVHVPESTTSASQLHTAQPPLPPAPAPPPPPPPPPPQQQQQQQQPTPSRPTSTVTMNPPFGQTSTVQPILPTAPAVQTVQPSTHVITPIYCPVAQTPVQQITVPTSLPTASWYPAPIATASPSPSVIVRPSPFLIPPSLPIQAGPVATYQPQMSSVFGPYCMPSVISSTVAQPGLLMPSLTCFQR